MEIYKGRLFYKSSIDIETFQMSNFCVIVK